MTADDVDFPAARRTFIEDDRLRPPKTVLSLAPFNGPQQVTLRIADRKGHDC
ncbi:hypothetical protein [Nonomuraea sp. SYSU D8015]|uniref:hypothetical protein n=1 Tax=Nonomuraea sp. SYSU D8015 TaxID=2593644 RepID=UPI0016612E29|nr:hypothetical protein [Nonomuraea sp. SYSU D8015]